MRCLNFGLAETADLAITWLPDASCASAMEPLLGDSTSRTLGCGPHSVGLLLPLIHEILPERSTKQLSSEAPNEGSSRLREVSAQQDPMMFTSTTAIKMIVDEYRLLFLETEQ